MTIHESREILERTPAVLTSLLGGLSEPWRKANEGPNTFSAHDIVGHLLHGEETDWMPRIRRILEHGPAVPFDTFDRYGFRGYGDADTAALLQRFAELRRRNLEALDALKLGPDDLRREGAHPALGRVTLGQLVATWAVHDLNHLAQAARVMARRYETAVGPWKEYLAILSWRTR